MLGRRYRRPIRTSLNAALLEVALRCAEMNRVMRRFEGLLVALSAFLVLVAGCKKASPSSAAPQDAAVAVVDAGPVAEAGAVRMKRDAGRTGPLGLHILRLTVSSRVDNDTESPLFISDGDKETAWSSKTGELEGAWVEMHVSGSRSIKSLLMTVGMTKKPASPGDPDLFLANPRTEQIAPTLCTSMLGETVYMWPRVAARGWPARAFSVQHRDVSRGRHAFRLRDDIVDVGLRTATRY